MDIRVSYFMMGWVVPFYMLFQRKEYLSMYRFFRRRLGFAPLKAFGYTYLNHFSFGQIILDRFAMYAGKTYEIAIEGYEHFSRLAGREQGFIQISSHTGNYELAGYSLVAKEKRFNALIFSGETETVMTNRNRMLSGNNIRLIPMRADMSHIFELNNALRDGEIVSMPGDRIFGSRKYVECLFLGASAKFPLGPFALAVQREAPTLAVFVMKESVRKYRIFVVPLELTEADKRLKRTEQMEKLARLFVGELETVVRRYPTQWFNYYEFWNQ